MGSTSNPASDSSAKRAGWLEVKRRAEIKFKPDFDPIRRHMGFNDLLSSVFELFFLALGAVTKIGLGVKTLGSPEDEIRSTTLLNLAEEELSAEPSHQKQDSTSGKDSSAHSPE